MPYEHIDLGPVPGEEQAASVGAEDYTERSRRECLVFKRMLMRLHPAPVGADVALKVKSYPHEFGNYLEVVAKYSSEDAAACDYAYSLESNSPANWDNTARFELWWLAQRERMLGEVFRCERDAATLPEAIRLNQIPAVDATASLEALCAMHTA